MPVNTLTAEVHGRRGRSRLDNAAGRDPVGSPCDACRHDARCKIDKLVCEALMLHMRVASPERWKLAPRQPCKDALARALLTSR